MGGKNGDFYVAPQLYYFLLLHQKPQALYAARGAQTAEVQGRHAQTAGICGRCEAQVCCLRQDGTRRSDAGIPFLLQVRGQLRILSGSSVHTSAYSLELESMKKKKVILRLRQPAEEEVSPFVSFRSRNLLAHPSVHSYWKKVRRRS